MASSGLFEDPQSYGVGPGAQATNLISDPLVEWIVKQVSKAEPGNRKWQMIAKECLAFKAGKQMSDEDERALRSEGRPNNAFNSAQKYVRYISGVQRDCPTALLFNAITMENDKAQLFGDQLGKYYDWGIDKSHGNLERSRAFEDFLVSGMGWTSISIDRTVDPRGLIGYDRISGLEMLHPENSKINLGMSDQGCTRWRGWERMVDNEEAKFLFDSKYAHMMIDTGDEGPSFQGWPAVDKVTYKIPYVQTYDMGKLGGSKGKKKDQCKILEFEWWDNDPGYLFMDPTDKTVQWMTSGQFHAYQSALEDKLHLFIDEYDRQLGRKWQRAFVLNRRYLLEDPHDMAGNRFSKNALCCHWDDAEKLWYGFFKVLVDPQKYANKFFNQMIEIIAKQAKGGAFVEEDAFEDDAAREAFMDEYTITGSVQRLASGGLGKIKEKQLPQVPAATMQILDFCVKSMEQVTGISEDSLGLGASTQAGIMLKRRQRAGMVLLAAEFDAESEFRKEEGYIMLDYLKLLAKAGGDGRLIRLVSYPGQPPGEVVPLTGAPFELDYDIELDEVERDPNMRQGLADWLMGPGGQMLMKAGLFAPEWLDILPFPRAWVLKMRQGMMKKMEQAQKDQAAGLAAPGQKGKVKPLIELKALVENKAADTMLKKARAAELIAKSKKVGAETGALGADQKHADMQGLMDSMGSYQELLQAQQDTQANQAGNAIDLAKQAGMGGGGTGQAG